MYAYLRECVRVHLGTFVMKLDKVTVFYEFTLVKMFL